MYVCSKYKPKLILTTSYIQIKSTNSLSKLEAAGIIGIPLKLFENYLLSRKQIVKYLRKWYFTSRNWCDI